jgi:hypothetical protein
MLNKKNIFLFFDLTSKKVVIIFKTISKNTQINQEKNKEADHDDFEATR